MLEFLFDLPLLITGPAIIGLLWLFALAGFCIVSGLTVVADRYCWRNEKLNPATLPSQMTLRLEQARQAWTFSGRLTGEGTPRK